jgi:hypothetical protein
MNFQSNCMKDIVKRKMVYLNCLVNFNAQMMFYRYYKIKLHEKKKKTFFCTSGRV